MGREVSVMDIMNIILEKGGYDNCTAEEKTAADNYAYAQVRNRRDKLLGWTDKYAVPDFAHKTEDLKASILVYRQALRDITDTKPTLNNYMIVNNITWPTHEYVTDEMILKSGPFTV
jgi:hypothetical protein